MQDLSEEEHVVMRNLEFRGMAEGDYLQALKDMDAAGVRRTVKPPKYKNRMSKKK